MNYDICKKRKKQFSLLPEFLMNNLIRFFRYFSGSRIFLPSMVFHHSFPNHEIICCLDFWQESHRGRGILSYFTCLSNFSVFFCDFFLNSLIPFLSPKISPSAAKIDGIFPTNLPHIFLSPADHKPPPLPPQLCTKLKTVRFGSLTLPFRLLFIYPLRNSFLDVNVLLYF